MAVRMTEYCNYNYHPLGEHGILLMLSCRLATDHRDGFLDYDHTSYCYGRIHQDAGVKVRHFDTV